MLERLKQKKLGKKGFTLAELLIVVAIVAILVAIAIPTFTASLNKARNAVDIANMRAAKAVVAVYNLSGGSDEVDISTDTGLDGNTAYFNAESGKFQSSTANAYVGQGETNDGQYIVATKSGSSYTLKWDSVA